MSKIKITCESNGLMPIAELDNFQGDLKTLDDESFKKLKGSIVKYGFSFPIFVWDGNILDGHQRLKAVKSLIDEGYTLDGDLLPVDHIEAKNEKEAAEKLLLINSRYAKIDQSGFDLFVENFDLDIVDLSDTLDIPEISFLPIEDGKMDYNAEWDGMPEFEQGDKTPYRTLLVHFLNEENLQKFLKIIGQKITEKTKYLYFPKLEREDKKSVVFITEDES